MNDGVTIGQAAAFVGVTIKTVRHYHRLGLLDEPRRDSSGYRRYGSEDLLRLVQVRTLAAAGVPLAEIGGLLDAEHAPFADAIARASRRLDDRIAELTERRSMLNRLADGDRALLPDHAVELLRRMLDSGYSADEVAATRESWILARALVPEGFDEYLADFEHVTQDAALVDLARRLGEAAQWDVDDPRLDRLASEAADHYLSDPVLLRTVTGMQGRTDASAKYSMIAHHGGAPTPAMQRLSELFEARLRAGGLRIPRPDRIPS